MELDTGQLALGQSAREEGLSATLQSPCVWLARCRLTVQLITLSVHFKGRALLGSCQLLDELTIVALQHEVIQGKNLMVLYYSYCQMCICIPDSRRKTSHD